MFGWIKRHNPSKPPPIPRWECLVEVTAPGDFPSLSVVKDMVNAPNLIVAAHEAHDRAIAIYPTAEVLSVRRIHPQI